uniref:Uncharacterized protein n=1 Tax=Romanomermis culicivorax TaxID=13658 RepID=A0A915JXQ7_ROMCU
MLEKFLNGNQINRELQYCYRFFPNAPEKPEIPEPEPIWNQYFRNRKIYPTLFRIGNGGQMAIKGHNNYNNINTNWTMALAIDMKHKNNPLQITRVSLGI